MPSEIGGSVYTFGLSNMQQSSSTATAEGVQCANASRRDTHRISQQAAATAVDSHLTSCAVGDLQNIHHILPERLGCSASCMQVTCPSACLNITW